MSALIGTIGKLWAELATVRREMGSQLDGARQELAEANERVVQLQSVAGARGDVFRGEHMRDLRRIAGLSTSLEPPADSSPDPWPPVIIRAAPRAKPPPRKPI